jgi:hypothetical protein
MFKCRSTLQRQAEPLQWCQQRQRRRQWVGSTSSSAIRTLLSTFMASNTTLLETLLEMATL